MGDSVKKITDYNCESLETVIAMLDEDGDDDEQFVRQWLQEKLDDYCAQFDPCNDA
jgi:hypothetical protein